MKPEPSCRTFAAALVLAAGPSMSVGCGRAAEDGAQPPRAVSRAVVTTPANPDPGQRWTHPSDGLAYVWIPPGSPSSGRFREVRGGSWSYYTRSLRVSVRLPKSPEDSQSNIGFRCAVNER
jgi:formylglycine-generating enzyme required for sulfatase activity